MALPYNADVGLVVIVLVHLWKWLYIKTVIAVFHSSQIQPAYWIWPCSILRKQQSSIPFLRVRMFSSRVMPTHDKFLRILVIPDPVCVCFWSVEPSFKANNPSSIILRNYRVSLREWRTMMVFDSNKLNRIYFGRKGSNVNETAPIPIFGTKFTLPGYRKKEKAVNLKQKSASLEKMRPFVNENIGVARTESSMEASEKSDDRSSTKNDTSLFLRRKWTATNLYLRLFDSF